jgi:hypothetical protein
VPGNAVSSVLFACWTPPGAGRVLLLCWSPQPVSRHACASDQACLPAARRPAAVATHLISQPIQLPLRSGSGMTHRDERKMRRGIKPRISLPITSCVAIGQ